MTVSSFMILAAACAAAIHPTTPSAVIVPESRGHIYAIDFSDDYKLSRQSSTSKEKVATAKKLKQGCHNFDMSLGQINVENLKWLNMSLSNLFDPCKNLKAVQTALSYYNTANFKSGFINTSANAYGHEVASYVGAKAPVRLNQEPQKSIGLHTKEAEQTMKTEPQPLSSASEELPDAFAHKASSARDAFTAEDVSSLEENDNGLELQF